MTQLEKNQQLTNLVLEVFRLNGQLLIAGDRLAATAGLTAARWQVMGAIELAGQPLSVAQIGRRMGLSRQAVQRIANDLNRLGFLTFSPNPDHARAKLAALSEKGIAALEQINTVQAQWIEQLGQNLSTEEIKDNLKLLRALRSKNEVIEKNRESQKEF